MILIDLFIFIMYCCYKHIFLVNSLTYHNIINHLNIQYKRSLYKKLYNKIKIKIKEAGFSILTLSGRENCI